MYNDDDDYESDVEFEIVGMELSSYDKEKQIIDKKMLEILKMNTRFFIYILAILVSALLISIDFGQFSIIPIVSTILCVSMANNVAITRLYYEVDGNIIYPLLITLIGVSFNGPYLYFINVALFASMMFYVYKRMVDRKSAITPLTFLLCILATKANPIGIVGILIFMIIVFKKLCPFIRDTEKPKFDYI